MTKGSDVRASDLSIDRLFIDRWSPRAMSGEPIAPSELLALFEAARWAPSSGNSQPWRFLYARRDTEHWPVFLDLLVERNREWCVNASALVVFVSRTAHEVSARTAGVAGALRDVLSVAGARADCCSDVTLR